MKTEAAVSDAVNCFTLLNGSFCENPFCVY